MVPYLHQSNVYIKRKLRARRVHKCIPLVGANTSLTFAGLQTTPSERSQYRAENGNLQNPGSTFSDGTVSAPSNVNIKRKLPVWRVQKCIRLVGGKTSLICAGLQTTPSQVGQYRAENGNLRKSGSTFSHGTVFAPKQCLYQTEATGMESPKMHSSCRCKTRTYLCGTANHFV